MKKLFFSFVAMFISAIAFGQASALQVENRTNCDQYYIIFGDEICACGDAYYSNVISIPPGGVHVYPTSTTLGGSYPSTLAKGIVGAKIPTGPPTCQTSGGSVGEKGCGIIPSYTFMAINQSCADCAIVKAQWVSAPNCDASARLIFWP